MVTSRDGKEDAISLSIGRTNRGFLSCNDHFLIWVISLFYFLCSVAQSCLTLCGPMDCSLPGSSVHENFQTRTLEWVAISYSRGFSQPRNWTCVSRVSCNGRWVLYHKCHLGTPVYSPRRLIVSLFFLNKKKRIHMKHKSKE